MHRALGWFGGAIAFLITVPAWASPSSQLTFSRDVGAESCPDEAALRKAVAARLGYDPFFPWAKRTIVTSLHKRGRGYLAQISLIDEQRMAHGAREFSTAGPCGDLLESVALAVAIAIDPESASPRPASTVTPDGAPTELTAATDAPPPNAPPSLDTPPSPAPSPPPPAERAPSAVRAGDAAASLRAFAFEASAGLTALIGTAPSAAAGITLGADLKWPSFSIGVEVQVDAPAGGRVDGTDVSLWSALGAVVPCAYLGPLFACAIVEASTVQASSDASGSPSRSLAWWGAGGRVGGLVPFSRNLSLRLRADAVGDPDPYQPVVHDGTWTSWPVVVSGGADALVHFP